MGSHLVDVASLGDVMWVRFQPHLSFVLLYVYDLGRYTCLQKIHSNVRISLPHTSIINGLFFKEDPFSVYLVFIYIVPTIVFCFVLPTSVNQFNNVLAVI